MTSYPKATWRPISVNYTRTKTKKTAIVLHSTASQATSQFGWFNNKNSLVSSHYHVDKQGHVEAYVADEYMAWTSGLGNTYTIGIETQGVSSKDEPWTKAQVEGIVNLLAWLCKTHGIPVRQMQYSLPSEKGIGFHRLGCIGNFPRMGILRGLTQRGRGQQWSSDRGKVCPGDKRIKQIPGIIKSVKKAVNGSTSSTRNGSSVTAANYVKYVQTFLRTKGYYKKNTYKIDGIAGKGTYRELQRYLRSVGYYSSKYLLDGVRGKATIKAEQKFLKKQGTYKGKVDGVAGSMTRAAWVKFLGKKW